MRDKISVLITQAFIGAALCTTAAYAQPLDSRHLGELGPLIPFHKDAIHSSILWDAKDQPQLCFWMRPSEYSGTDLVDPATGPVGALKETFNQLVYGGFGFSQTLDASVLSRIKSDIPLENTLCLDLTHSDAFKNPGKFNASELTEEDFAMNIAAFRNAGSSRGLNYNLFCGGHVTLADGRLFAVGGHDKTGNGGIRKINIFDPITETWEAREVPPVKRDFLLDPTGTAFPHPSARNEANTDPTDSTDMLYQRWYPSAVALPNGKVLILSGTDIDTSVGPEDSAATKIRMAVPEVYDPSTGKTVALLNAQKTLMMYPRAYVIQTGPGKRDWKVAVMGEVQPPFPGPDIISEYDPFTYNADTYLFDVQAALRDPNRGTPAENHWERVARASSAHNNGGGAALWSLDRSGLAISQKVIALGGDSGRRTPTTAIIEMIDYSAKKPKWIQAQPLVSPATQQNAVVMPDGKVLIIGGRFGRGANAVDTLQYQLLDPETGKIKVVGLTTVPRHDHSTALLLPDASVIAMGGNRVELVPGDRNAGVPVAQIYKPPYLFNGERPEIEEAPRKILYEKDFWLETSDSHGEISSVALIRTGPVTHNWDWGNRYVKLSFKQKGNRLKVSAPAVAGAAVPGPYMLFVLNSKGVPSKAKLVYLGGK